MKLHDFALLVHGEVRGDETVEITGVSDITGARQGDITFLASPKYARHLPSCKAACLIVKEFLADAAMPQVRVGNPHYAFAKALEVFYPAPKATPGIHAKALVADSAVLGQNVTIHPFAHISGEVEIGNNTVICPGVFIGEKSRIGDDCVMHPNVTIRDHVTIGNRVVIHAGTVIGSDGFGYVLEKGEHYKIPQVGGVIIGDDVEIGSNVSIDRATLGNTIVGRGSKIDNLVQIAHNVKIGERSLIISQVGIGGSTEIGDYVVLAGQVGVADHAKIDSGTMVGAQSGIAGHLEKGGYSGSPVMPHKTWLRAQAAFARLPELLRRVRELEEKLNITAKGEEDAERH